MVGFAQKAHWSDTVFLDRNLGAQPSSDHALPLRPYIIKLIRKQAQVSCKC